MGRIQRKVYAVVELYDRFTGKPIQNGILAVAEPRQQIIYKENGCIVFLEQLMDDSQKEGFSVEFSVKYFKGRKLFLKKEPEDAFCHRYLWMEPDRNYSYPAGTTCVIGTAKKPGMYLVPRMSSSKLRMMADYRAGNMELALHGLPPATQGRQYIFYKKGQPASEVFTLKGKGKTIGNTAMVQPLGETYKKSDIAIYPAYPVLEQEDGTFFIALDTTEEAENISCDFILDGKKLSEHRLDVGKWNRI